MPIFHLSRQFCLVTYVIQVLFPDLYLDLAGRVSTILFPANKKLQVGETKVIFSIKICVDVCNQSHQLLNENSDHFDLPSFCKLKTVNSVIKTAYFFKKRQHCGAIDSWQQKIAKIRMKLEFKMTVLLRYQKKEKGEEECNCLRCLVGQIVKI